MAIKQFNASYLAQEDRLLFRFNTVDDSEFRFWFTRRVTLFILAATSHLIIKNLEKVHAPEVAKAIDQFVNESVTQAQKQANEGKTEQYQSGGNYPLGAEAVLILDVKCNLEKKDKDDLLLMDFILPGGANITLSMAGPTLRAMCGLLNQLREHAAWGEIPELNNEVKPIVAEGGENDTEMDSKKPQVH